MNSIRKSFAALSLLALAVLSPGGRATEHIAATAPQAYLGLVTREDILRWLALGPRPATQAGGEGDPGTR